MWLGALLALTSAACWSCANVAIKGVASRLGPWCALVWMQLIGGTLVALIALLVEGLPPMLSPRAAATIGLAGLCATMAYAGLFTALARGAVAVVTPVITSWAVLSVLIGAVLLDEQLGGLAMAGVAAVVAGNVLLASTSSSDGQPHARSALLWALASACGFGVMVPAVNAVGEHVGRLWTVPLVWSVELVLLVPVLWWRGRLSEQPHGARAWWQTARASLLEVSGFVAMSFALGMAPVAVVSPLASLATAGSVLLGLLILRERPGRRALLGAALASAGVVLVNLHG